MDQNSRFLLKNFRRYYKENTPIMPDRFARREFGFMFFDRPIVQRHIGFTSPEDLTRFLIAQVPSHCYYSTAYYRRPDAPTMEDKDWLGAELIFDLDADHLKDADKMTYSVMMEQIRKEMIGLVDSFLCHDLGFSTDDIQIMFSGGRGYHAHIRAPDVLTLGTHERRELVDYITCSGLDMKWVFDTKPVPRLYKTADGTRANVSEVYLVPPADSGGWKLKMREGLKELTADLSSMDNRALRLKYPSTADLSSAQIKAVRDDLGDPTAIFERNNLASLKKSTCDKLMSILEKDVTVHLAGEVDKPVTPDIKRLIRLPGSIHGKTGLRVTPVTRDQLDGFDPLRDAVPDSYSDDPVKITMRRDYELEMKGERFTLKGETEAPEYAAIFLVGRKAADFGHLSERRDPLI